MSWRRRVLLVLTLMGAALWLTTAAASAQSLGVPQAPANPKPAAQAVTQAITTTVTATASKVTSTAPASAPAKAAAQTVQQTVHQTTAAVSETTKSAAPPV